MRLTVRSFFLPCETKDDLYWALLSSYQRSQWSSAARPTMLSLFLPPYSPLLNPTEELLVVESSWPPATLSHVPLGHNESWMSGHMCRGFPGHEVCSWWKVEAKCRRQWWVAAVCYKSMLGDLQYGVLWFSSHAVFISVSVSVILPFTRLMWLGFQLFCPWAVFASWQEASDCCLC